MVNADFPRPHALQFSGNRMARALLRLAGWRVLFDGLPARQGVLAVYPHTSNWDTVVLLAGKVAMGVPMVFLSKASLFRIPLLGRYLRWMGGMPIDRSSPGSVTDQVITAIAHAREAGEYYWLCLTPEGTRAYAEGLRSGFYRIAHEAGVPLGLVRLDYALREISVVDFIGVRGDRSADMQRVADAFDGAQGLHPAQASPLRLLDGK
ncbi:MAG: 1-acyl-sn-glycerol-3-phosphate acyltransferase [Ramlibacter sp.]